MLDSALAVIAAAVLLGVAGQILASLTRLPAIIFLLILGMGAGPHGLAIIEPAVLGDGLGVLVSAFVAIILFEGALTLRPELLRQALAPVRRLITVGAAVTLFGAATLAHFIVNLPWEMAFLFASLIVVTGPTVIAPILRRVRLLPRLHAILKSESILIDPIGVFVAVTLFQYVVGLATQEASWHDAALGFLARVGAGMLVGGGVGFLAAMLARCRIFARSGNEHLINLGALGMTLGTFALAEAIQHESGIMAVIVAGLILAAAPLPFRAELEKFKEHVTTLGVSVLFILLSANLNLELLVQLGWQEALLLAGLILVVRPASVFLATWGTDLGWREKSYLSLIAPRGILAAAMSSYFAAQLRERGLPGADRIELLVFFTIAGTVFLQGGWASLLARVLRVRPGRPRGVLLVGVNDWSVLLAQELQRRGRAVLLIDNNPAHCDTARERGLPAQEGDATCSELYEGIDLSTFGQLIAMTPNDAVNTLACDAAGFWLPRKGLLQVISKPMGEVPMSEVPRSGVRMGGRWAMPTHRSHREVIRLLRDSELRLDVQTFDAPITVNSELPTPHGQMVPLLIACGDNLSVAVLGAVCSPGSSVIGLIPAAT